jgi:hypothetical protein
MKKIVVSGSIQGETRNFRRVKIEKVERTCSECGRSVTPDKPFGAIYIPKGITIPEQIIVTLKGEEGKDGRG